MTASLSTRHHAYLVESKDYNKIYMGKIDMTQLKKIIPAMFLASAFAAHSATVLADHGAMGFGIGTASPIITQPGITLPTGMWATGLLTSFISFNSASDATLFDAAGGMHNHSTGHVHSVKSQVVPSVFAAYGVTDNLTLGVRLPYVQRFGVRSPDEDNHLVNNLGNPGGFGGVSLFGQYRFFHTVDQLNHLSLVVALKTPTGATRVRTDPIAHDAHHPDELSRERFDTHFQPSSGSWNPH